MYKEGEGVPQDYKEAVKWYRKAADQGSERGQYFLGLMYKEGEGVPQDYIQAHMWYNLSASQGFDYARKARDSLVKEMTRTQIAEAQKLAREWRSQKPGCGFTTV